jgi:hypothetical protein
MKCVKLIVAALVLPILTPALEPNAECRMKRKRALRRD